MPVHSQDSINANKPFSVSVCTTYFVSRTTLLRSVSKVYFFILPKNATYCKKDAVWKWTLLLYQLFTFVNFLLRSIWYITCKKFRTFYFGRLILGHIFSHFGQIFGQRFWTLRWDIAKANLSLQNLNYTAKTCLKIVFLYP